MRDRARELRAALTPEERALWGRLRAGQLGVKFKRQVPVGCFIPDFVCLELRLIVELDGRQHKNSVYDHERDNWLESRGFKVIRYWNERVQRDVDGLVVELRAHVNARQAELKGPLSI